MICAYLCTLKTLCLSYHYDVDDDVANGDDDDDVDVETDDDDDEDNDNDKDDNDSIRLFQMKTLATLTNDSGWLRVSELVVLAASFHRFVGSGLDLLAHACS